MGQKEKRLTFSVIPLKNEGEMHLMFRKIYAAITPRRAAIGKSVAYHSSLHKNHPVINSRTSPTTFSINSVDEFLLEKKCLSFLWISFYLSVIQNISIFPHTKHEFLFFSFFPFVLCFCLLLWGKISSPMLSQWKIHIKITILKFFFKVYHRGKAFSWPALPH